MTKQEAKEHVTGWVQAMRETIRGLGPMAPMVVAIVVMWWLIIKPAQDDLRSERQDIREDRMHLETGRGREQDAALDRIRDQNIEMRENILRLEQEVRALTLAVEAGVDQRWRRSEQIMWAQLVKARTGLDIPIPPAVNPDAPR